MIVVTGGAGFIGSNIVAALCRRGDQPVTVVDDLSDGHKFENIVDHDIADYVDMHEFRERMRDGDALAGVQAVFHQGACSETTQWDGRFVMDVNFEYSKQLYAATRREGVPLIYASSAAVYGASAQFSPTPQNERPINVYGYSKLLFDRYVARHRRADDPQCVGLRYFNVYGPNEQHKGRMASVALHAHHQLESGDTVTLFAGCQGYGDGEQRRDFVYIDDVVDVNLWLLDNPQVNGVLNVGTGRAQTFNELAGAVVNWHARGTIEYIPFPDDLVGRYQSFTEADLKALRAAGYSGAFRRVEDGVRDYLEALKARGNGRRNR